MSRRLHNGMNCAGLPKGTGKCPSLLRLRVVNAESAPHEAFPRGLFCKHFAPLSAGSATRSPSQGHRERSEAFLYGRARSRRWCSHPARRAPASRRRASGTCRGQGCAPGLLRRIVELVCERSPAYLSSGQSVNQSTKSKHQARNSYPIGTHNYREVSCGSSIRD